MLKWILNLAERIGSASEKDNVIKLDGLGLPIEPPKELIDSIEYPTRPRGIKTHSHKDILSLHKSALHDVHMLLSLPDNVPDEGAYTFSNLIMKPIEEFTRYVHLLPASENHHHNGVGGLLSHSISVGLMSLKEAYRKELPAVSYQDNERNRKSRYLYASFICGLFHDAGKVFDVDVVAVNDKSSSSQGLTWSPLQESLLSWAENNNVKSYEIIWRKRLANAHTVRTSIFFERCLNSTCRKYLSDIVTDRIYDSMLTAASSYLHQHSFISDSVRAADFYSTGTDLNVIAHPLMGTRSIDAVTKAFRILRDNLRTLNINDSSDRRKPPHIFVIGSELYLTRDACLSFILGEFKKDGFTYPDGDIGLAALEESLILKGYVEPYSEDRYFHSFHPGEYIPREVVEKMRMGNANLSWFSLLKLRWVGLIFDSFIIPDSVSGIFTVNEVHDYLYVDRMGEASLFERSASENIKLNDVLQQSTPQAKKDNSVKVAEPKLKTKDDSRSHLNDAQQAPQIAAKKKKSKKQLPAGKNPDELQVGAISQMASDEASPDTSERARPVLETLESVEPVSVSEAKDKFMSIIDAHGITEEHLCLVDGVLFVDINYFALHGLPPALTEVSNSITFCTTVRDGMLEPEIIVPTTEGKSVAQLSADVSALIFNAIDLTYVKQATLAEVFSDDIFAPITVSPGADSLPLLSARPIIPPERIRTENVDSLSPDENEGAEKLAENTAHTFYSDSGGDAFSALDDYSSYSSGFNQFDESITSSEEFEDKHYNKSYSSNEGEPQDSISAVSKDSACEYQSEFVSTGTTDPSLMEQCYKDASEILYKSICNGHPGLLPAFIKFRVKLGEQSLYLRTNISYDTAFFVSTSEDKSIYDFIDNFPIAAINNDGKKYYVLNLDNLIDAGNKRNIDFKLALSKLYMDKKNDQKNEPA